jgi:hypothetical protein
MMARWDLRGKAVTFVQANGTLLRTFVQRCGVYLALTALMLQFALSFGHIHAHDIFGPNAAYPSSYAVKEWHRSAKLEASAQHPWKLADDDDHCPICFSTFLLGNSLISDPPQPPLPARFAEVDRFVASAFNGPVQARRGPFQSRAPPLAS